MLILTRRIGETVHIGGDIKVTVLRIDGQQVRIGIAAPKEVPVHRAERKPREATCSNTPPSRPAKTS